MNQDSSFPPMLPPSTELGALLFAVLPCLQETYRPFASFVYHMTELTKLKTLPSMPPLSGLSGVEAFISDKDTMLRSLSFYGKLFHMPLLSTIASLFQAFQFYHAYKDILPGLFSSMQNSTGDASPLGGMGGLFSGLGGGSNGFSDILAAFGGLSPDVLSSLFSGFTGGSSVNTGKPSGPQAETVPKAPSDAGESPPPPLDSTEEPASELPESERSEDLSTGTPQSDAPQPDTSLSDNRPSQEADRTASDELIQSLSSFLTPDQRKIYEQLMHTD